MQKKHLNRILRDMKKETIQRRFVLDTSTDDTRRMKSLLRTLLSRKTNDEENKWLKQEITARGKYFQNPLIGRHDRNTNLIEFPPSMYDVDFWPAQWFLLDRIAEARAQQKIYDESVTDLAHSLPLWEPWASKIKGLGPINLANVLSATGDLWLYENAGKVWKRMGLALVRDHGIQRKSRDKELALLFAYSPARRALMFVVSDGLMKGGRKKIDEPTPRFKIMYDLRKEYEMGKEEVAAKGHAHNRALRYIAKRWLKELLQQWRVYCP